MQRRRLLVLGASGWFGQTLNDLKLNAEAMLPISSSNSGGNSSWNFDAIRAFRPTTVVNFAFLTPDKLLAMGAEEFQAQNLELLRRFSQSLELPSVRESVAVSSGAVLETPRGIYAQLKAEEEAIAQAWAGGTRIAVILRAFSMSGPHVRVPQRYAFSDFVLQARRGVINVLADRPTYRRYISVKDFLTVGMGMLGLGSSCTIESGGELVEMGELAEQVIRVVNPSAFIERQISLDLEPSIYASNGQSWLWACKALNFEAMDLSEQIKDVKNSWQSNVLLGEPRTTLDAPLFNRQV